LITLGTLVPIVAIGLVGDVHATEYLVASIISADVFIVAIQRLTGNATARHTLVPGSAGRAIGTPGVVGAVYATGRWVTRVVGAGILVVAAHDLVRNAPAPQAVIAGSARVAVVAVPLSGCIGATGTRVAGFNGARIFVVTNDRPSRNAIAACTSVTRGTGVIVRARTRIGNVDAPKGRLTQVIGAQVVIRAIHRNTAHAHSIHALLSRGAQVAIVTRLPLVVGGRGALSCSRVAYVFVALLVHTFSSRALHRAARHLNALVRTRTLVAVPGPQTQVPLSDSRTIVVRRALTQTGKTHAFSREAGVAEGARVEVIAR